MLLLVALLLAGVAYAVAQTQAWGVGADMLHAVVCAVGGDCEEGQDALDRAYGVETAGLVHRYSPNVTYEADSVELPVDFRRCRKVECSNGPAAAAAIDRSSAGLAVTAFTRVVDRRSRGGALYIQYWFYYPESLTGGIGRIFGDLWPGYHADDWEGVQFRISSDGAVSARATEHGGYSSGWSAWTGWYRVRGGSHAGELARDGRGERTTTAGSLRLVPLESLEDARQYRFEVSPPWLKEVYLNPEADSS